MSQNETFAIEKSAFSKYFALDYLKNGRLVLIRAIAEKDRDLLQEGMHHLSDQSRYNRFFTYKDDLSDTELDYFTHVDFVNHVALIAGFCHDFQFQPAASARYILSKDWREEGSAELAMTVVEEYQGQGFATILLQHLVRIARSNGLTDLYGLVLPSNSKMLNVMLHAGLPFEKRLDESGEFVIRLSLQSQPKSPIRTGHPKG